MEIVTAKDARRITEDILFTDKVFVTQIEEIFAEIKKKASVGKHCTVLQFEIFSSSKKYLECLGYEVTYFVIDAFTFGTKIEW